MALTQYAYIYTDPRDYSPFYVGKGTGYRATAHMAPRGSHNLYMQTKLKSLKNKGFDPIITKIETSTEEFALLLEQGLIKIFGRKDIGKGTLLNLTDGGEGATNFVQTPEANAKRSKSLRKFYSVNERKQTQESIDKMKMTKRLNKTGTGKWMQNGERQTKVKLADQQKYLNDGWSFGRLLGYLTAEYRTKIREKTNQQWDLVKQSGHSGNLKKVAL